MAQPVYDYNNPYRPPEKKSGGGCCSCSCTTLLLFLIVLVLLFFGAMFLAASLVINAATSKETDVYEGMAAEKSTVQEKIRSVEDSATNSQLTTTAFSMQELNIIYANNPSYRKRIFFTSTDDVMDVEMAIPVNSLIRWAPGNKFILLDVYLVPEITDGKPNLQFKSIKYSGGTVPADMTWLSNFVNYNLNTTPYWADKLSHIKSFKMENDHVVLVTH